MWIESEAKPATIKGERTVIKRPERKTASYTDGRNACRHRGTPVLMECRSDLRHRIRNAQERSNGISCDEVQSCKGNVLHVKYWSDIFFR
jgi:hypothetical protein